MPLTGRGDVSRTAARRDIDGRTERCNEEAEVLKSISESLQSVLYQQTGLVECWILNINFLILATISKLMLKIKTR